MIRGYLCLTAAGSSGRRFCYLEPKRRLPSAIASPYRTQEVAGSSPASSTGEIPAPRRSLPGEHHVDDPRRPDAGALCSGLV